ncbi:hypothetical protein C0993_011145 [Termitomyces sp. T159_Od127]|nr:hypothetical protein C0993_011145 [Termitomyces sp. T159_Od127]
MSYFKKHWPKDLQTDILKCIEEVFQERFLCFSDCGPKKTMDIPKSSTKGFNHLLHELSDDKNDQDDTSDDDLTVQQTWRSNPIEDPTQPWSHHFDEYINSQEKVSDGCSMIEWWGFDSRQFHSAWSSLAHDYLAIMASSVSSEQAFLQGGLTITKQRNQLKSDIVEALQCLKCAIRHDLLFRQPGPSSLDEAELEKIEDDGNNGELETEEGWDELFSDDEDENDFEMDIDLDSE